jgi:hypothetical protein
MLGLAEDRLENSHGEIEYGATMLSEWRRRLRRTASIAFAESVGDLDGSGRALKAVALAERQFRASLYEALHDNLDVSRIGEQSSVEVTA